MNAVIERTAIFIDGDDTYAMLKALRLELDFKSLRGFYAEQSRLIRAHYFAIVPEDDAFCTQMPLLDWLEYNGFSVLKKRWRVEGSTGRRKLPNIHVEIAVEALTVAHSFDRAVFISSDVSLTSVVRALKNQGKIVTVIWTLNEEAPIIPDTLRREADEFLDVASLPNVFRLRPEPRDRTDAQRPAKPKSPDRRRQSSEPI